MRPTRSTCAARIHWIRAGVGERHHLDVETVRGGALQEGVEMRHASIRRQLEDRSPWRGPARPSGRATTPRPCRRQRPRLAGGFHLQSRNAVMPLHSNGDPSARTNRVPVTFNAGRPAAPRETKGELCAAAGEVVWRVRSPQPPSRITSRSAAASGSTVEDARPAPLPPATTDFKTREVRLKPDATSGETPLPLTALRSGQTAAREAVASVFDR